MRMPGADIGTSRLPTRVSTSSVRTKTTPWARPGAPVEVIFRPVMRQPSPSRRASVPGRPPRAGVPRSGSTRRALMRAPSAAASRRSGRRARGARACRRDGSARAGAASSPAPARRPDRPRRARRRPGPPARARPAAAEPLRHGEPDQPGLAQSRDRLVREGAAAVALARARGEPFGESLGDVEGSGGRGHRGGMGPEGASRRLGRGAETIDGRLLDRPCYARGAAPGGQRNVFPKSGPPEGGSARAGRNAGRSRSALPPTRRTSAAEAVPAKSHPGSARLRSLVRRCAVNRYRAEPPDGEFSRSSQAGRFSTQNAPYLGKILRLTSTESD